MEKMNLDVKSINLNQSVAVSDEKEDTVQKRRTSSIDRMTRQNKTVAVTYLGRHSQYRTDLADEKFDAILNFLEDNGISEYTLERRKSKNDEAGSEYLVVNYNINGARVTTNLYGPTDTFDGATIIAPSGSFGSESSVNYHIPPRDLVNRAASVEEVINTIRLATGLNAESLSANLDVQTDTNGSNKQYQYRDEDGSLHTIRCVPNYDVPVEDRSSYVSNKYPQTLEAHMEAAYNTMLHLVDMEDVINHYMKYPDTKFGTIGSETVAEGLGSFYYELHKQLTSKLLDTDEEDVRDVVKNTIQSSIADFLGITVDSDLTGNRTFQPGQPFYAHRVRSLSVRELTGVSNYRFNNYFNNCIRDYEASHGPIVFSDKDNDIRMATTPFKEKADPLTPEEQELMDFTKNAFEKEGAKVDSIELGDYGIAKIIGSVERTNTVNGKESTVSIPFTTYAGPFYAKNENGMIKLNRYDLPNHELVPGYVAHLTADKSKSIAERTRVLSFDDILKRNIRFLARQCVNSKVLSKDQARYINRANGIKSLSDLTAGSIVIHGESMLSHTYSSDSYAMMYPDGHFALLKKNLLMSGWAEKDAEDLVSAIQKERRVRFNAALADTANTITAISEDTDIEDTYAGENLDIIRSNGYDEYIFDVNASVNGKNVGSTRFLTSDAKINEDGSLAPGKSKHSPLFELPIFENMNHSSVDRAIMTYTQLLTCTNVASNTGIAYINANGWNLDDGIVISKKFAEKHHIIADGVIRPLRVQDKISTTAGNKGVISLIVDPEDETQRNDLFTKDLCTLFEQNPDLDAVLSPYSPISRTNMTNAVKSLEDGNHKPLVLPNGTVIEGGLSLHNDMIITDMAADVKSHDHLDLVNEFSDDKEASKARSLSNQLIASLVSQGADYVVSNQMRWEKKSFQTVQDLQRIVGVEMFEDGTLQTLRDNDIDESLNNIVSVPSPEMMEELSSFGTNKNKLTKYINEELKNDYGRSVFADAGYLKLPFTLKHKYTNVETNYIYMAPSVTSSADLDEFSTPIALQPQYKRLIELAYEYTLCDRMNDSVGENANLYSKESIDKQKERCRIRAQHTLESMERIIGEKALGTGKMSMYRTKLMRSGVNYSSTKVWSENPSLDLDQVEISAKTAKNLGVKEGDGLLMWRDPMKDTTAHLMHVKIADTEMDGCTINPLIGPQFEGDFDGDSIGMTRYSKDVMKKLESSGLHMRVLLVNADIGREGEHPIAITMDMDVMSNAMVDYGSAQMYESVIGAADLLQNGNEEDKADSYEFLNTCGKELLLGVGTAYLDFDSPQALYNSMKAYVEIGAKGNDKKLNDAMWWAGYDVTEDGQVIEIQDKEAWETERAKKNEDTFVALGAKAYGTAFGGYAYQLGLRAFGGSSDPTYIADIEHLTSQFTQGMLQAKHSAEDAKMRLNIVCNIMPKIWNGDNVRPYTKEDGSLGLIKQSSKPITTEDWKRNFRYISAVMMKDIDHTGKTPEEVYGDFYKPEDGEQAIDKALERAFVENFNPDSLDRIADAMSDESGHILGLAALSNSDFAFMKDGACVTTPYSSLIDRLVYTSGVEEDTRSLGKHASPSDRKMFILAKGAAMNENLYGYADYRNPYYYDLQREREKVNALQPERTVKQTMDLPAQSASVAPSDYSLG